MNQSLGSVALYDIIIVFIVITFSLLTITINYNKAFRVGSRSIYIIEINAGYNQAASNHIRRDLDTLGYRVHPSLSFDSSTCPVKSGQNALPQLSSRHELCIYRFISGNHYKYGVLSYMYVDLPVVGNFFKVPIYVESDYLYNF
jgi:hypothetical protein